VQDYEVKYPKVVKSLVTNVTRLLSHFDFSAAHWNHLRSTNPIESTFATVKLRTRMTKGAERQTNLDEAFSRVSDSIRLLYLIQYISSNSEQCVLRG
jgi:transposase-like protein